MGGCVWVVFVGSLLLATATLTLYILWRLGWPQPLLIGFVGGAAIGWLWVEAGRIIGEMDL